MLFYIIVPLLTILVQQPPDIWHDPNALALMGIGAGILGAIATIGATIYTVRQGRTKRKIDYQVISDSPIVTVNSTVAGKVQVLFNGQPVNKTRVIVLEVRNTGNSSIHKEDYFEPLTFEFDTDVISAEVLETEPPTLLGPRARKNFPILGPHSVQFPPFPLNRHDSLTMTILLKDESAVRVIGRLDQGTINIQRTKRPSALTVAISATLSVYAVTAILASVAVATGHKELGALIVVIVILSLILSVIIGTLIAIGAYHLLKNDK